MNEHTTDREVIVTNTGGSDRSGGGGLGVIVGIIIALLLVGAVLWFTVGGGMGKSSGVNVKINVAIPSINVAIPPINVALPSSINVVLPSPSK